MDVRLRGPLGLKPRPHFLIAIWAIGAAAASAWCREPQPRLCSEYFENDAVFVGRVVAMKYVENDEYLRYTVEVQRVFKGEAERVEHVLSENTNTQWRGEVGQTYLVFTTEGRAWAQFLVRRLDLAGVA